MFNRALDPGRILKREDERGTPLDPAERQGVGLCHFRHGFNHSRGERGNDQQDQEPVQSKADARNAVILFKNGVHTATERADALLYLRRVWGGDQWDINVGTVMD